MTKEELREKRKEYAKRSRDKILRADPDYFNRRARLYRERHREKMREYMRAYMKKYWQDEENYKKQVEYSLNWYKKSREKKNVQAEE